MPEVYLGMARAQADGALDHGNLCRRTYTAAGGRRTQHLPHSRHQHRLACSRLPRNHIEAWLQHHMLLFHKCKVPACSLL